VEIAQRRGDLARESELLYGVIPGTSSSSPRQATASWMNEAVTEIAETSRCLSYRDGPVSRWTSDGRCSADKRLRMETSCASVRRPGGGADGRRQWVRRARAVYRIPKYSYRSFCSSAHRRRKRRDLKALAEFCSTTNADMVRIDMSEYRSAMSVAL